MFLSNPLAYQVFFLASFLLGAGKCCHTFLSNGQSLIYTPPSPTNKNLYYHNLDPTRLFNTQLSPNTSGIRIVASVALSALPRQQKKLSVFLVCVVFIVALPATLCHLLWRKLADFPKCSILKFILYLYIPRLITEYKFFAYLSRKS
jgi:hypothetical protein